MKGQKSFSVDFCLTGLFSHRKALSFSSSLGLPNQCLACGAMQKAHIICIVRGYLFCKKPNHVREEKQEQNFLFGVSGERSNVFSLVSFSSPSAFIFVLFSAWPTNTYSVARTFNIYNHLRPQNLLWLFLASQINHFHRPHGTTNFDDNESVSISWQPKATCVNPEQAWA